MVVAHDRRRLGHRIEQTEDAGPQHRRLLARCPRDRGGVRGAGEVEQVRGLSLIQLQRAGESFEHAVGGAGQVTAFEPCVVVHTDAREQ